MDREAFVGPRTARWRRLESRLGLARHAGTGWAELAADYRAVCADLATARSRGLPDDVTQYLDQLAGRAHNALYGGRVIDGGGSWVALVAAEFPRELRRQWPFFLGSCLLFFGPFAAGAVGGMLDPRFATLVLPEDQLRAMEAMYSSADVARGGGQDAAMAGYYVWNNVGIAFRCFTTGVLAGLGTVFFLVYNGLVLGTVSGHLVSVGLAGNFLAFTAGHSAWELIGIAVSGAAGLRLGWAVVATGGRTRAGSLRAAGPGLFRLVVGTTALLAVAAMIEGFWSASPVPPAGKYAFGVLQCGIVAAWLGLGGRRGS